MLHTGHRMKLTRGQEHPGRALEAKGRKWESGREKAQRAGNSSSTLETALLPSLRELGK